jgi:Tol biopolymer transport system component
MKTLKSFPSLIIGLVVVLSSCEASSPDQSKIAFIGRDENKNFQIYTTNSDGSETSQLTNIVGGYIFFTWSPDGRKIAFSLLQNGDGKIFIANTDGSGQVHLTDNGVAPVWSPNGSKIAFISSLNNPDGKFDDIYVMDSDGTEQKRITRSFGRVGGFSWSPDGQKIVFAAFCGSLGWDVFVINSDGSNEINLTNSLQDESDPAWSPTGDKIIFTSYPESDTGSRSLIYIVNADGSNQKRLTNDSTAEIESYYSWSPDGNHIAYATSDFDIFIINADGSNQRNITATIDELCSLPTWSPDGSKVAFLCSPRMPNGRSNIWIASVDHGTIMQITDSIEGVGLPAWSPWFK